jgi:hypothetical protein
VSRRAENVPSTAVLRIGSPILRGFLNWHSCVVAMTDLLLQPTGDPDDYEVAADGQIVGRVVLLAGAWSWAIDTAFREGRHPAFGFESTRDAALQAFTRSWFDGAPDGG